MSKYRLVVEHIPTDKVWYGESETMDSEELADGYKFIEYIIKGASNDTLDYFALTQSNRVKTYFSPLIIKECTISIEMISGS